MSTSDDTQLLTEIRDLLKLQTEATREWREKNRDYEAWYERWQKRRTRETFVWFAGMLVLVAVTLLRLFVKY